MTLDINNRAHTDAIAWACGNRTDAPPNACGSLALAHVSEPSLAVELIAAFFKRCGAAVDIEHHRSIQWRVYYYLGGERLWFAVNAGDAKIAALILRLLDTENTTDALTALRETVMK